MATVAFAALATQVATAGVYGAQAAAVFAAVGTVAATYIDQKYTNPFLFGVDDAKSPSQNLNNDILSQLNKQQYSEGSEAIIGYGLGPRFAGTVIWASDIIDESPKFYRHIAVGLMRNPFNTPIKVWANSKLIYDRIVMNYTGASDAWTYTAGNDLYMHVSSEFYNNSASSGRVDTTGWDVASLNGNFAYARGTTPQLNISIFNVADPVGQSQPWNIFIERNGLDDRYDDIRFYYGSGSQVVDPLIAGIEGVDYPAHRFQSYMVIERLDMQDFGQQIPQFNFVLDRDDVKTTADIVADILSRAGFAVQQFSFDSASMQQENGYVVSGITSPIQQLKPLLFRHDIIFQEDNGVYYFYPREKAAVIDLDSSVLSAHEEGRDAPDPFLLNEIPEKNIPEHVYVKYSSEALDYQQAVQSDKRRNADLSREQILNMPLTMTDQEAKDFATRELYRFASERQTVSFTVPPSHLDIMEGDIVTTEFNGEEYEVIVTRIQIGANFITRCEGIIRTGIV